MCYSVILSPPSVQYTNIFSSTVTNTITMLTGLRPHTCPICSTCIRRKDNLERHIRNTHPESYNAVEPKEVVSVSLEPEPPRANAVPVINAAPSASGILPPLPPPPVPIETQQCHGYTTRNLHPENSPHLFISSKNLTPL